MSNDSPTEISNLLQEIESLKDRVASLERRARGFDVPLEKVDSLFFLMFEILDDDQIPTVLRNLHTSTLASAVGGLDIKSLGRIRANMSVNAWHLFVDEIHYQARHSLDGTYDRQKVVKLVWQLLEMGEISSEELYLAIVGEDIDPRRREPFKMATDEERALAKQKEVERRVEYDEWLKTLAQVEAIKKPNSLRLAAT